jgi:cell division transport system permease protein
MGFDLVLKEDTSEKTINAYKQMFTTAPYVSEFSFFSSDDALRLWQEDTGEDLTELLGVNPFSPEFEVKVRAAYASSDSIEAIASRLSSASDVEEVKVHTELVDSINRNLRNLSVILVIVAVSLLLISFVLINNTVRLTVYSRRFLIHTMTLVGATGGFIRKPFILNNLVQGIIASVVAVAALSALISYASGFDAAISQAVAWAQMLWVFAGMLLCGIIICVLAALMATNRYLRLDYDDMFK